MALELNKQFSYALTMMEQPHVHLFITGKAGTGKSTLLDYFCEHARTKPIVLAPTGVAALNVKGQTIHRFFNFYIDVTPEKILSKESAPSDPEFYKNLHTIIIDEVSMLRADMLDCIDVFLRMYGADESQAFGGVKMIFVGDLYQLPPVTNQTESDMFTHHYNTPYFFSAKALEGEPLEVIELETIYRQKDEDFVHLLNKIRTNSVEDADIDTLNTRYIPIASEDESAHTIHLTTTNSKADAINATHLEALPGKLHMRKASIDGDFGKEYHPTAQALEFKIGAHIMLLNNDPKQRWVNGTLGKIIALRHDEEGDEYIRVRLHDTEQSVSVYPFMWEVYKFSVNAGSIISKPAGSFTQYPFRLAWAITIHKSQGKTFDHVVIDMDKGAFSGGQTYVAFSRCTSFEGIRLATPIKKGHIRTDARIFKFLTSHAYAQAALHLSWEDKITMLHRALETQHPLEMVYLKANDHKSTRIIIPRSIGDEEYRGKIFPALRAYCTTHHAEYVFHIGRILQLKTV
ncbi:MAG: AAA family ATPase [Alphaproteobacteria bacterium]|nr:MAG: AAA family ATPase [Alphaproteobacteria bacterium]